MKRFLGVISLTAMLVLSAFGLSACGEEPEPPHTHSYVDSVVAPTCIQKGYTLHSCECGDSYQDNEVNALGHDFGEYVYDNNATYTSDGTKTANCKRDGCTEKDVVTVSGTKLPDPAMVFVYKGNAITGLTDYGKNLKSLLIPEEMNDTLITSIGEKAFAECNILTSIVIPDSVTNISNYAFYECYSLINVTIGDSVKSIGDFAFLACDSLTNITVESNNANYKSKDGNLYSKDGKTLIRYATGKTDTSFTIPDGVQSIGLYAFNNCKSLKKINFGANSQLTKIRSAAFEGCSSLIDIEFPKNMTRIGDLAFRYCRSLKSIVLHASVELISEYAFYDCTSLTSVYYTGTAEDWDKITISNTYNSNLTNATRYYYIENESDLPADNGNYWHYVDGVPTVWVI